MEKEYLQINGQHVEYDVPLIEISPGWVASEVSSIEECDKAYEYLMSACADIERDLDLAAAHDRQDLKTLEWIAHAKCALKYKRASLAIVDRMRARIMKAEKAERNRSVLQLFAEEVRLVLSEDDFNAAMQRAANKAAPA